MRPSAAPLRSLRLPRPSTSSLRRFAASPSAAAPSSASPQPYTPPIEPGVLPAYDLCLQYIKDSAASQRAHIPALEEEIERLQAKATSNGLSSEELDECKKALQRMRKRVWLFKGAADRYDPQVRYDFAVGLADPTTDSFRYLDHERFEVGGSLDLHVQNINAMHVVPDVCDVGRKGLSIDLLLRFPAPPPKPEPVPDQFGWIKSKSDRVVVVRDEKDGGRIVVGSKLTVGETRPQPEVEIRYFDAEPKFGTLVMVDPDVPSPETHSFTEKLHWLVPNIPLSSAARVFPSPSFEPSTEQHTASLPEPLIPYLPPHPHKGSPSYHRYVFALLTHSAEVDFASIKDVWQREGATLRQLQEAMGKASKELVDIAGLTFFRADYDPVECSKIWEEVIKEKEVKFLTPSYQPFWVPDPTAVPLNASFRRPSTFERSASLKQRNKALLYNQKLGIIPKASDRVERFVTTDEWDARKAAAPARGEPTKQEQQKELSRLFGDRVTPDGQPIFNEPVSVEADSGEIEIEVEAAPAQEKSADVEPEQSKP